MLFFGAFTLLVLPLFLIVCIQMIKNSQLKDTVFGKFLLVLFYLFAALAIGTGVYLVTQL
jgi:hypothetical protein